LGMRLVLLKVEEAAHTGVGFILSHGV